MTPAAPRSERGRRAVVIVAALSLLAWTAAALWGARLAEPDPRDRDSYTRGPLGHRALVDVLDEAGLQVTRTRDLDGFRAAVPLLLIEPDDVRVTLAGKTIELAALVTDRTRLSYVTVVVLPKWGLVMGKGTPDDPGAVQAVLTAVMPGAQLLPASLAREPTPVMLGGALGTFSAAPQGLQAFAPPPNALEWLRGPTGTVVAQVGSTIVISDPDLVHNFDLHRADHAQIVTGILARVGADAVAIDEVFHGHGLAPSLGAALGRFPAVLLVLHALLFAFVAAARGLSRLGPVRPEVALRGPRERFGIAAAVLASGQRPSVLAATYARRVLDDVGHAVGPFESPNAAALAQELDAAAERRGIVPDARRLLANADDLEASRRPAADAALRLARRAWAFRERMLQRVRSVRRDRSVSSSEAA